MSERTLIESSLPGIPLLRWGKVRDIYDLDQALLLVTSDRLSGEKIVSGSQFHL